MKPDDSVHTAVTLLVEKDIGALLVMNDGNLVGVVSERDCTRKMLISGRSAHETTVSEIMSTRIVYARPDNTVDECMALMSQQRVRHLPILTGDEVVGVLSQGDLVKEVISEQKLLIDQLEHYITG